MVGKFEIFSPLYSRIRDRDRDILSYPKNRVEKMLRTLFHKKFEKCREEAEKSWCLVHTGQVCRRRANFISAQLVTFTGFKFRLFKNFNSLFHCQIFVSIQNFPIVWFTETKMFCMYRKKDKWIVPSTCWHKLFVLYLKYMTT